MTLSGWLLWALCPLLVVGAVFQAAVARAQRRDAIRAVARACSGDDA